MFISDDSAWRNAISLGVFRTEDAANRADRFAEAPRRAAVRRRAARRAGARVFVQLRDAPEPVRLRFVELKDGFSGSDVRECPAAETPEEERCTPRPITASTTGRRSSRSCARIRSQRWCPTASEGLRATHLPVVVEHDGDRVRLLAHIARANPQWRDFADGREAMTIFAEPHAYVSPRHYERAEIGADVELRRGPRVRPRADHRGP